MWDSPPTTRSGWSRPCARSFDPGRYSPLFARSSGGFGLAQITQGIRRILSLPIVYRVFSVLLGEKRGRTTFVAEYLRLTPGDALLDMGCGPGSMVAFLPPVTYVGFDFDEGYVLEARRRFGDRGTFLHAKVGDPLPIEPGTFDVVTAVGVLHHLDDHEAESLFRDARGFLKPGGRLVTWDPAWDPDQSRIARWFISKDRGRNVRTAEQLSTLASPHFSSVQSSVRHDLLPIPYTIAILQCAG